MKTRETFGSRLGFLLLSAGCAIGIGNVWRFPYVVGANGGGVFVLFYLIFLVLMGIPVLAMEFAVGRGSKKSAVKAYQELEKPGQKWHIHGALSMAGNYLLMMFYTTVAGWMVYYFVRFIRGDFVDQTTEEISAIFTETLVTPGTSVGWMAFVVIVGIAVCAIGLQKGVERITKVMMIGLLGLMVVLAVQGLTLEGGMEGLKFYLYPDWDLAMEVGLFNVAIAAMNQAFFTLSLGIGSMAIFGSYLDKKNTLLGEAINVAALDTFVAIMAGLIIFPACFAFGIAADSGPGLIFITLPNVFTSMVGGQIWGSLFFLFMSFAAFSTVIAVCEHIVACCMDLFGWERRKSAIINIVAVVVLSIPCALGSSLLSWIEPFGTGTAILDLEDFIVSYLLLPLGSLTYLLFCTSKYGWGFKKFQEEANQGKGLKVPNGIRVYVSYVLPILIFAIFVKGMIDFF